MYCKYWRWNINSLYCFIIKKKGINDIGIVVGYQDDVIKEVLSDEKAINFFYNPFYEITNSLASAWFAGDFIDHNECRCFFRRSTIRWYFKL